MTNTRLTMDELECSLVSIKRAIPMIHQQADHELELCRETCMWIRFLYEDSKMHATALAIASAALTSFRSKLNGCDWADCALRHSSTWSTTRLQLLKRWCGKFIVNPFRDVKWNARLVRFNTVCHGCKSWWNVVVVDVLKQDSPAHMCAWLMH